MKKLFPFSAFSLTQIQLIVIVSAFLVFFDNYTFFSQLFATYSAEGKTLFYLLTTPFVLFIVNLLFFLLLSYKWTIKPVLILVLIVSSFVAYFMDSYHIIVDKGMIHNTLETDFQESLGLLNVRLILYVFFLGLLPSYFVYKVKLVKLGFKGELLSRLKLFFSVLAVLALIAWSSGGFYASLFKEHRVLRNYTNPYFWIKSSISYTKHALRRSGPIVVVPIGLDAKVVHHKNEKPKLVIFIVGEATRADQLGINGYIRKTTPRMEERKNLISFSNFYSCGTYTVYSVPCMFSKYDRADFSREKEEETENIMDLLAHTGEVDILWRDNNSDPKGVMERLEYEDYRSTEDNPDCKGECRDEGMLSGLDHMIENNTTKDKLIVLHAMGNHGPEYYKRYPKKFEKFTPVCRSNLLEACTQEEIANAYDNILLYSDDFIDRSISLLEQYEDQYDVALIYISDHGESLGENGLYLHGLPYMLAPDAQKHVAAVMWFGKGFKILDIESLKKRSQENYSHDNIFSTLLGLFDVNTTLYEADKDMLNL